MPQRRLSGPAPLGLTTPPGNARAGHARGSKAVSLALVQFAPRKGDVGANLESVGAALSALQDEGDPLPDVVVFPEACLSGYFVEGGVREVALGAQEALQRIARAARNALGRSHAGFDAVLGFYEQDGGKYYNSALYGAIGQRSELRHVHRKLFLPTYGVFDEERFVSRGRTIECFNTRYGRAAILICEDACHSLATTIAALKGAEVIYIPSASPGRGLEDVEPANVRMWRDIMRVTAAEHGIYVAYAGLVGFEGGKGFTGGSRLVGPFGDLRGEAPFAQAAVLRATMQMEEVTVARASLPMLGDLETNLAELGAMLQSCARAGDER
jgi:predicted amidohydrolase